MSSPGLTHDTAAIERARTVAAGEAGRIPSLSDGIGVMSPLVAGQLESSPRLIRAVAELTAAVVRDLRMGGEHLRAVDRALDDTMRSMQELDRSGAGALAPGGG